MTKAIFTPVLAIAWLTGYTQEINPPAKMGGREVIFEKTQCISDQQHAEIKAMLQANKEQLIREGKLKPAEQSKTAAVKFNWPLKQMPAYDYNCYYGISNYVDHNVNYPGYVTDYNCGVRSYDDAKGYNHSGTDFFIWPFSWLMMQRKQVAIVAAAPGIIIGKTDGNFDKNCQFNSKEWNAVYVQHADGSVAWYGHMKKGSLTTKNVGDAVAVNEKLGFVGSSGNSNGPHLHFEVYNANDYLVDPWKGPCGNVATSWWKKQKPYWEPKLNTILTQTYGDPYVPACPGIETTYESNSFLRGDLIYFTSYFKDERVGLVAKYKITKPDKTVFAQWKYTSTGNYTLSYWWWAYYLPTNAPGTWKFQAIYQGDTLVKTFTVTNSFAVNDVTAHEKNDNAFALSPNPAHNNLKIAMKGAGHPVNYKIYDVNGRLCKQGVFNKNETNISITELQKGIYCLKLSDTDGALLSVKKFMKL
ncbi:MAG TPA: peptidoglycan DD-metalloendopeptidase family protein [Parafilimonas sp.]|nr:peptidoglycan DD-metalloendopeptidase family protein [Parafilimonas sp.]